MAKITFEQRLDIVNAFVSQVQPPGHCLDVLECQNLAALLDVKTGTRLRSLLSDVKKAGGPDLAMPYTAVCAALQGEQVDNVRPTPRSLSTARVLPPLDFEVPVALSSLANDRSQKPRWDCKVVRKGTLIGYCKFYRGCQAAHPLSILPCEGYWIEKIQTAELIV